MSNSTTTSLVYSEFADDPDFQDLLEMFTDSLNDQRSEILSAYQNQQWKDLGRIAHQLKGAGGGYGFPGLTTRAHALEAVVQAEAEAEIASQLEELFAYIDRIRA